MPELLAGGWALLVVAAALVGFAKTAIGGAASIAVALFALELPARESTGALLVLLICGDVMAVAVYHRHADRALLLRLLPWVVPGVLLGTVFIAFVDDGLMRRAIGAILVVVVALSLLSRRPGSPLPEPGALTLTRGRAAVAGAGAVAGFTTMVANAAGPVMTVYLVLAGLPKLQLLGTVSWFFLLVNVGKVPFSAGLGLMPPEVLVLDLVLAPAVVVGGVVGMRVIRRIDQRQFETAALVLTAVAAAFLLA